MLLVVMLSTKACVTANSNAPATRLVIVCPNIVEYQKPFLIKVADELKVLPQGSAISIILKDTQISRAEARECQKQQKEQK
jgi:hypothetical protein